MASYVVTGVRKCMICEVIMHSEMDSKRRPEVGMYVGLGFGFRSMDFQLELGLLFY